MLKLSVAMAIAGSAAVLGFGLADAQAPAARAAEGLSQCFESTQWRGWKAADSKTLYIDVNFNSLYRVDMAQACPELLAPNARLITQIRGSSLICSPLDLDLKVSEGDGFATPCIVSKITPLTAAEAAALPKKFRP